MQTPKEYKDALESRNLSLELIGDVLFSYNKRAKNMRDKERLYRNSHRDKYNNEERYREQKEQYYGYKDQILRFFTPSCVHIVKRDVIKTIDVRDIQEYENFKLIESFEKFDRDIHGVIELCKISYTRRDCYLFYVIGAHSFHTPIDQNSYDVALPEIELDELDTTGDDIGNLLPVQFCEKIRIGLLSGSLENPTEIDPQNPAETDPLFYFQLAPRITKFSRRAKPIYRVTKQPFSAIS